MMYDFMAAFSLGAGYTIALIGITLAFMRSAPAQREKETPSLNAFVSKDEFDMLCRVVHDLASERHEKSGT